MSILREHLRKELIITQLVNDDVPSLIHRMTDAAEPWVGVPAKQLEHTVLQGGLTSVGNKVAIPHGRMSLLDEVVLVIANSKKPIEFSPSDSEGVQLIFMLIVPKNRELLYLKLLAKISMLCSDKEIRESLIYAKTAQEIINIIEEAD